MKIVLDVLTTVAQKILVKHKFTCFYLEVHSLTMKNWVKLHTQVNILLDCQLSNNVRANLIRNFARDISV